MQQDPVVAFRLRCNIRNAEMNAPCARGVASNELLVNYDSAHMQNHHPLHI